MFVGYLTLISLITWSVVVDAQPGFVARISKQGLEYAAEAAVQSLATKIVDKPLHDKSGSNYEVTQMKIREFVKPASYVELHAGSGLTWSLSNAAINLAGNWKYTIGKRWYKITDSGTFEISARDIRISVTASAGMTDDGKPTLQTLACTSSIGKVEFIFSNPLAKVLNKFLESPMRNNLEQLVCTEARKQIDVDANKSLLELNFTSIVDHFAILDYRLVSAPKFEANRMELRCNGRFQAVSEKDFNRIPVADADINFEDAGRMVSFFISKESLDSAAAALFNFDRLKYHLIREKLPDEFKPLLDIQCSSFACAAFVLPPTVRQSLEGYVLSILVRASDVAPSFTIRSAASQDPAAPQGSVTLRGTINATFEAGPKSGAGPVKVLFSTRIEATVNVLATMEEDKLVGRFRKFQTNILEVETNVGPLSKASIGIAVKIAAKAYIQQINEVVKLGFKLPTLDDYSFENLVISLKDGFVAIYSDVRYHG